MLESSTWLAERRITFWEEVTPTIIFYVGFTHPHPCFASREGPASEAGKGRGTDGSGAIPAGARAGIPEQTASGESGEKWGWHPECMLVDASGEGDSTIK